MLFYRKFYPLSHQFRRSSGRNHHGVITSWSRRTIGYRRSVESYFCRGLHRVVSLMVRDWNQGLLGLATDARGLLGIFPVPLNSGGWLFHSLRPSEPDLGVSMPLRWIPVGLRVARLARWARAGGTSVQILRHRRGRTQCRLPSKEVVWIGSDQLALIGRNGLSRRKELKFARAGQLRWLGRRPQVRGVAMNPVDHPHGGGQGKTSGGRPGVTPWGVLTKGYKPRSRRPRASAL